ncbi:FimV/HubP family polar landmark protein [Shewanella sp. 10N.261.52.F9]|uniref:FimV/HubP family polar landmark protein n=1 Tax=Shewanella sp. 10N.261.52.F9 TaxID=3229684 RepID=UPI00354D3725
MKKTILTLIGLLMLTPAYAQVSHVSINQSLFELGENPNLKLNIVSSHNNLKKVQFSVRQADGEERLSTHPLNSFKVQVAGVSKVTDKNAVLIIKEYRVSRWYQVKIISLFNQGLPESAMDSYYTADRSKASEQGTQVSEAVLADNKLAVALGFGEEPSIQKPQVMVPDNCSITFNGKESLWRVANRQAKLWGLSAYGAMLAIYESNPNAFNKQSIHGLKADAKLNCPSKDILEKHQNAKTAEQEFSAME